MLSSDFPFVSGNLILMNTNPRIHMIPYNQKMFGEDLNQLGTYWLEKLPNVSFEETLLSCLTKKAYGRWRLPLPYHGYGWGRSQIIRPT
jgi:hypothetical protein